MDGKYDVWAYIRYIYMSFSRYVLNGIFVTSPSQISYFVVTGVLTGDELIISDSLSVFVINFWADKCISFVSSFCIISKPRKSLRSVDSQEYSSLRVRMVSFVSSSSEEATKQSST